MYSSSHTLLAAVASIWVPPAPLRAYGGLSEAPSSLSTAWSATSMSRSTCHVVIRSKGGSLKKGMFLYVGPLKALYRLPPGRPVHSDTNSASPGSILAMQQVRAMTKSLTVTLQSTARYSFIQLSGLMHREENETAQTSKRWRLITLAKETSATVMRLGQFVYVYVCPDT